VLSETVYLGRDNRNDLLLKADGTAQDLSAVTKITAAFGDDLVESDNGASDPIRWDQPGQDTGVIWCSFGGETLTPNHYHVPFVLYDVDNPEGVQWGPAVPFIVNPATPDPP
jgi:hypothetical protein